VGGRESSEFLRQNQLIRSSWGNKAVPICEALPGLNHFSILEALVAPTHLLHHMACDLLFS
jgi:arylformamidase